MPTSDANTASLAFAQESTYGVLPGSPQFRNLRLTGESLNHTKETVQSAELRRDRQIPDMAKVGSSAAGGFNFELSFLAFQAFFEALLCGTITEYDVQAITGDFDLSSQTFTAGTPGDVADVPIGGFVKIAGAVVAGNNGVKRVLSNDGTVITFAPGSITADDVGVTADFYTKQLENGITRRSYTFERQIENSVGSLLYQTYPGCYIGEGSLNVESKQIITGVFNVLGKFGETSSTSLNTASLATATGVLTAAGNPGDGDTVTIGSKIYTFQTVLTNVDGNVLIGASASDSLDNLIAAINLGAGSGTVYAAATTLHPTVSAAAGAGDTMNASAKTAGAAGNAIATTEASTNLSWAAATLTGGVDHSYLAAHTGDILNGTSNLGTIQGQAGTFTDKLRVLAFSVNNNLRGKDALGEEGNFEVGIGRFNVTGNISAYFADNTLYQALIDHDDNAIGITLEDSDGNILGVTFPRIKWGNGNPNLTAIDTDVMLDIDFSAIMDPTTGVTMIMNFIPAVP